MNVRAARDLSELEEVGGVEFEAVREEFTEECVDLVLAEGGDRTPR